MTIARTNITTHKHHQTLPKELTIDQTQTITVGQIQTSDIVIKQNAELTLVALLTKGWSEIQKLNFHLEGENSKVTFIAIILARDEETFPFETISNHSVRNTNAYYYIRSAMFDKSMIDYKGNLIMKPEAQITDSYLAHHTLMLSKDAKVNTVPSLEIEADDVKAGHAATIGNVDEDMIFYLESRGINKKQGQEMLIRGFLEHDLKKIPNEEVRTKLALEIGNLL
ncbi:MAG: SufD family Fe-S cluster assembly protein [bacterium]|nr:SufD family Fe-S cluster assembly protein [bacterium]